jgi:O-acetyl-ADP-ribose deacetylase (regulator of RNase III)
VVAQQYGENKMNEVLIMAIFSLLIGLGMYIWLVRSEVSYFYSTNIVTWLLIALFPVLLIFSYFPDNSITGTIKSFSMGGAIAAFAFIWWYGSRMAIHAKEIDTRIEKIRMDFHVKLQAVEEELEQFRASTTKTDEKIVPTVLLEPKVIVYKLKEGDGKYIGFSTGDIRSVKVADIWVNSENTNMQMSRFYERTISAIIRYLGAKKDFAGNITQDVIANELAQIMENVHSVQPGTVLVTEAGELSKTNNVKKVFHVGAVQGEIGFGYRPVSNIETCITNVLVKADSNELKSVDLKSILFPLIGTGSARGDLQSIAERIILSAVSYLETAKDSTIERVYFLTWTNVELETCRKILESSGRVLVTEKELGQTR